MLIPKELIGAVIGPGGKVIQGIQEESGATVSIDEIAEGGHIEVAAANKDSIDKALAMINAIVELPEEGKVYEGTVRSIMDFGRWCRRSHRTAGGESRGGLEPPALYRQRE